MSYVIYEMPDGRKELINFDTDNDMIIDIVRHYCGDDFATGLSGYINSLRTRADYETLRFESDMEVCEEENQKLSRALKEIDSNLRDYEYRLERGTYNPIYELFDDIHELIDEVV